MSGEVLIVLWIALIAFIAGHGRYQREELIDGDIVVRYSHKFAVIAFLPVILWAGFRSKSGYADTSAYVTIYSNLPQTLSELRIYLSSLEKDVGFYVFGGIIKIIFGENFRPFLLIIAVIQGVGVIRFYRRYSSDYVMSIFLFIISAEYLAWMMNGIRQFLAVTIIYFAIPWLLKKRYTLFILVVFLASTVHQSALIMIPIAFVVQGRPWNMKTLIFIGMALVALFFTNQFTGFLDTALENTVYSANLLEMEDQAGVNPLRVGVYSIPALLAFIGKKQIAEEENQLMNISVNMSIITMALYLIAMATSGIMMGRLPIYTSMFNYVLLPYEINHIFNERSARLVKVGMVILYLGYYYYLMHFAYGRI